MEHLKEFRKEYFVFSVILKFSTNFQRVFFSIVCTQCKERSFLKKSKKRMQISDYCLALDYCLENTDIRLLFGILFVWHCLPYCQTSAILDNCLALSDITLLFGIVCTVCRENAENIGTQTQRIRLSASACRSCLRQTWLPL